MIYLATASGPTVTAAIAAGEFGQIVQPNAGNRPIPGARWAADNGCFGDRWDPHRWEAWLDGLPVDGCLFAVVPDVVADAEATNRRWARYHGAVRNRGLRAAYVGQNGCTAVPASAGALFLGGDTEWKLGRDARRLAEDAKARGLWLHMGRVNTLRRLRYAAAIGCDSVDGTFLAFGPDRNLPQLRRFLARVRAEPTLEGVA